MVTTDLASHWHDLFGAALLGAARRHPPAPPPGPIAELLVELPPPDAATNLLEQVAATAALRRAGAAPLAAAPPLQPPSTDGRPEIPEIAVARLAHVLDSWPALEPEWLGAVIAGGWRFGPDTAVSLLRRHRTDAALLPLVLDAAGPLAGWLAEHVPSLAPPRRTVTRDVSPEPSLAGVPDSLVAVLAASADESAAAITTWFSLHHASPAHRAPLVAWMIHLPPPSLPAVADALRAVATDPGGTMLAATLTDLAMTRHLMLLDLHRDHATAPTART